MKNNFTSAVPILADRLPEGLLARLTLVHEFAFDAEHQDNSQMRIPINNPGQRGAYIKGMQAKRDGLPRATPYKGNWVSRYAMERAWLQGYDAEAKKP